MGIEKILYLAQEYSTYLAILPYRLIRACLQPLRKKRESILLFEFRT